MCLSKIILLTLLIISSCVLFSQSVVEKKGSLYNSIKSEKYNKINNRTLDLDFLIELLPDNSWRLKLFKDSNYEYIHWSGWGPPKGYLLENGSYTIVDNILLLTPESGDRVLSCTSCFISFKRQFSKKNIPYFMNDTKFLRKYYLRFE